MPPPLLPFALAAPVFRFRHLAALAGRAPIGGAREVALACFVAARLASECATATPEGVEDRAGRCSGAKAWLGTLALPADVRRSAGKCADLTVSGEPTDVGREVAVLVRAATAYLDGLSRAELDALSLRLAAAGGVNI